MGGEEEVTTKQVIRKIEAYILKKGFNYEAGMIENLYLSLKAKRRLAQLAKMEDIKWYRSGQIGQTHQTYLVMWIYQVSLYQEYLLIL